MRAKPQRSWSQACAAKALPARSRLIGEEAYIPYQRPPLSKAFLAGELAAERLFIKPEEFYPDAKCTLMLNTRATSIDRARKVVKLEDGREMPYATLALTTGSRIRTLPLPAPICPAATTCAASPMSKNCKA